MMLNILSFPPGVNPYHYTERLLEEKRYPSVHGSTFNILKAFGAIHMCIICVCWLVVTVPIVLSAAKRLKYLWTFKKAYAGKSKWSETILRP
ncbi:hypothetical protein DFH28DRAFT_232318 [Melampsora americana]|nr:hypothetical protein DFH28DRAFT_232318 [Melampsora americana]